MYLADAEFAKNLAKATKNKGNNAHPGQVEYTHWINCVGDSSAIVRKHGILPVLKKEDTLKLIIPGLAAINDHFNCTPQNKATTKAACMEVVKNLFGAKAQFVSSVNGRVLEASKLYNNPMSLLVFQKLFHAYAIRKHKKSVPFLAGGVYHGCKNAGSHARDSLFMKDGTSKNKWNKVDDFRAFSLVAIKVFVSPQTMATHLYKFMGYGDVQDNAPLRELKQQITL